MKEHESMNHSNRRQLLLALAGTAFTTSIAATLAWPVPAHALVAGGVDLPDSVRVGGRELRINGAGVRTRAMFKVYAMGLYLTKKETETDKVLALAGPRRVHLSMLRDVNGEDFGGAFMAGINANTDKAERSKILGQITKFGEIFISVGNLKKGDTVTIDWIPERGSVVEVNGKAFGEPLPGIDFANAFLKIWLGEKPVDPPLKTGLLGGKIEG
jgi:hypothetical protein